MVQFHFYLEPFHNCYHTRHHFQNVLIQILYHSQTFIYNTTSYRTPVLADELHHDSAFLLTLTCSLFPLSGKLIHALFSFICVHFFLKLYIYHFLSFLQISLRLAHYLVPQSVVFISLYDTNISPPSLFHASSVPDVTPSTFLGDCLNTPE